MQCFMGGKASAEPEVHMSWQIEGGDKGSHTLNEREGPKKPHMFWPHMIRMFPMSYRSMSPGSNPSGRGHKEAVLITIPLLWSPQYPYIYACMSGLKPVTMDPLSLWTLASYPAVMTSSTNWPKGQEVAVTMVKTWGSGLIPELVACYRRDHLAQVHSLKMAFTPP